MISTKILIIYGSREGHTHRMAQVMGEHILKQNPTAELTYLPLADAYTRFKGDSAPVAPTQQQAQSEINTTTTASHQSTLKLTDYDGIVIGCSVHYGFFPKLLYKFCDEHAITLNSKYSFLFTTNLVARKPDKDTVETNVYTKKLLARLMWEPIIVEVFAGAINYSQLNFIDKNIVRFIMFVTKGDTALSTNKAYTDWDKFQRFSETIAYTLNH